ncbi:unnamed protein product, partial [marine sediment metagenome]
EWSKSASVRGKSSGFGLDGLPGILFFERVRTFYADHNKNDFNERRQAARWVIVAAAFKFCFEIINLPNA